MGSFHLSEATIWSMQRALRARELSARQLVELYLEMIKAYDRSGPTLNAVLTVSEVAVADAAALDARFRETGAFVGPLHRHPHPSQGQHRHQGDAHDLWIHRVQD